MNTTKILLKRKLLSFLYILYILSGLCIVFLIIGTHRKFTDYILGVQNDLVNELILNK